jgi:hypothetical protein
MLYAATSPAAAATALLLVFWYHLHRRNGRRFPTAIVVFKLGMM